MSELMNISVVLPSLDPDEKLITVVDGLLEYGFTDIILVNDGSKAENMHWFHQAAQHPEVHLLHHEVNRGKGAALKTAFTWFLENRSDKLGVVTVDGDNQHHPEDTRACALHMAKHQVLTLGVRDFSLPHVPERSRKGNRITSAVFKIFCGMEISDTQTGLRAIPRKDLEILNKVWGDRFEYETNMLLALKENGIPFDEVKIRTVYIEENKSSHFRVIQDSWRIYKLILGHFFKYTASSLLSSLVDTALYTGMNILCKNVLTGFAMTAIPFLVARVVSSVLNFYMNKRLVFHSKGSAAKEFLKYLLVALPTAGAQVLLTHGTYLLFGITEAQTGIRTVIYVCVMTALFFLSYSLQERWVFLPKKIVRKESKTK